MSKLYSSMTRQHCSWSTALVVLSPAAGVGLRQCRQPPPAGVDVSFQRDY